MLKKIFLFFLIININVYCFADTKYKILVSVNNETITQLDLEKELKIIKILNKKNISKNQINIAINNLVEEKIKNLEILKEKRKISQNTIDNLFIILLNNLNIKDSDLDQNIKDLIKNKIRINKLWDDLVAIKYSWKINVNMEEINKKILQDMDKIKNHEIAKDELILIEKNKKLAVYSKYYLNSLKNKALIKFY